MNIQNIKLQSPGSLVWNNQHIFFIKSIDIPEPEKIEAFIKGVPNFSYLLDIKSSVIFKGIASVEFKGKDIYSFELYADEHKFKIVGYVEFSDEKMLQINCKETIEIIY